MAALRTSSKIVWGVCVVIVVVWAFFYSLSQTTPRWFWSSDAGQSITLAFNNSLQSSKTPVPVLRKGDLLPPLTIHDLHGASVVLRPKPGQKMLINVWATWCAPCQVEMPVLDAAAKSPLAKTVAIVGISADQTLPVVVAHLQRKPVSYPIYWDPESPTDARARLGNGVEPALPYSVLIDATGRIEKIRLMDFQPGEIERWAR